MQEKSRDNEISISSEVRKKLNNFGIKKPNQNVLNFIKTDILDAISKDQKLQFKHVNNFFGDHYIIRYAFAKILCKFLFRNKLINDESYESLYYSNNFISLSHNKSDNLKIDTLLSTWGFNHSVYDEAINNFYYHWLYWFADHLDIEIDDSDLISPPLPLPCDFELSPMRNFDINKTKDYSIKLKNILKDNITYCIVLHGGRLRSKRFGKEQVKNIQKTVNLIFPDAKYIILTAEKFDEINSKPLISDGSQIIFDAIEDINLTTALAFAPFNITYIGTDTFLTWLMSGAIAMRDDRKGILRHRDVYNLYTIASPSYWSIPGVNNIISDALVNLDNFGTSRFHIIDETRYRDFFRRRDESETQAVNESDVNKLLEEIVISNKYLKYVY